jgi:hypothetical protein
VIGWFHKRHEFVGQVSDGHDIKKKIYPNLELDFELQTVRLWQLLVGSWEEAAACIRTV